MNRWSPALAVAVSLLAAGCGSDNPTAPTATKPTFAASMSGRERSPTDHQRSSLGPGAPRRSCSIRRSPAGVHHRRDGGLQRQPDGPAAATTTITASHIHPGARRRQRWGCSVNLGLTAGENCHERLWSRARSTKTGINVDPALAQTIINNPAGYYSIRTRRSTAAAWRGDSSFARSSSPSHDLDPAGRVLSGWRSVSLRLTPSRYDLGSHAFAPPAFGVPRQLACRLREQGGKASTPRRTELIIAFHGCVPRLLVAGSVCLLATAGTVAQERPEAPRAR